MSQPLEPFSSSLSATSAWQYNATVYQVYPRSFKDSNGDGIGDLRGVIQQLDYLQWLGIDVVWLSPIYDSPNDDNGYDIRDYRAIMREFGTMADFDELLAGLHARGMKLMMDLVVNHTSDEHAWFIEAKNDPASPKRGYYHWQPGKGGARPNNWVSFFDGSVWDKCGDEYYLHLFSPKQPDLNWANPALRREIYDMMRWWLDKGVDGFRLDAISYLGKPADYPEGVARPGSQYTSGLHHYLNRPELHSYLHEMYQEALAPYDVLTVGEMGRIDPQEALEFIAPERQELFSLFQFRHTELLFDHAHGRQRRPLDLVALKRVLSEWQTELHGKGWNALFWSNHDLPRAVSLYGNDSPLYRTASAKLLCTTLLFMQGTPYIYQGEEIGMADTVFADITDMNDVAAKLTFQELTQNMGLSSEAALNIIRSHARDHARTPMQWDGSAYAGFSQHAPWLAVNPNYPEINVAAQQADPYSVLHHYRRTIAQRKAEATVREGSFTLLEPEHPALFVYRRDLGNETLLVISNFSAHNQSFALPDDLQAALSDERAVIISDNLELLELAPLLNLQPWQSAVIKAVEVMG